MDNPTPTLINSAAKVGTFTKDVKITKIESMYVEGEEWLRVIAKEGNVEMLITNPHLPRITLGDTMRVTLSIVEDDAEE